MRVVKNSVPMFAAMLLSGIAVAATSKGVPTSVVQPVPTVSVPVVAKPPAVSQPAQTYADTSTAETKGPLANAAQPEPADVNVNIPYASVLPKDAQIVPGAPGKNEFFIVAAEDAAKIKQLIDHTKPGTEVAASNIKTKKPIVKVKLDEGNSTLVSMDVVSSVKTVVDDAVKQGPLMTKNDEVMSIYTKDKITPVGSRVVAVAPANKPKVEPDEIDEKPMFKLLASTEGRPQTIAHPQTVAQNNPLQAATAVRPPNKFMPDKVAVEEAIQQPTEVEKPVELPLASKESAPTLEMVLQQAKKVDGKEKEDDVDEIKAAVQVADNKVKKLATAKTSTVPVKKATVVAVDKAEVKNPLVTNKEAGKKIATKQEATKKIASNKEITRKVASKYETSRNLAIKHETTKKVATKHEAFIKNVASTKAVTKKFATKAQTKKSVASRSGSKSKLVAGRVIPFERIRPDTKTVSWSARHTVATKKIRTNDSEVVASKKVVIKKDVTQRQPLNLGSMGNSQDYLPDL